MNKKKTILTIVSIMTICLVVVLGVSIFGPKDNTYMKKNIDVSRVENVAIAKSSIKFNDLKTSIEADEDTSTNETLEEMKDEMQKKVKFREKLDENLRNKYSRKNTFKRFKEKQSGKLQNHSADVSTNARLEALNEFIDNHETSQTNEDDYVPHWVHNHENGVICKACGRPTPEN